MQEMIAHCGLVCTGCPAFIATQQNNDEERKRVVEKWSSDQFPLSMEDINCDGCLSTGKRIFKFCNDCEVRVCAVGKGVANCAYCDDFACSKLDNIWKIIDNPEARERLEAMREDEKK